MVPGLAAPPRIVHGGDGLEESATAIDEFGDRRAHELDALRRESLLEVAGVELVRTLGGPT
jgi:hypothetical protein